MGKELVPDNYKVIERNGFKGIIRVNKNGVATTVIDFMNVSCGVAKSYGRIYLYYLPSLRLDGNATLCDYSGKKIAEEFVYNIKFGSDCIFGLIKREGLFVWALLDKDLKVQRVCGDFEFNDVCCTGLYIPAGKDRVQIKLETGEDYWLYTKSGGTEAIIRTKSAYTKPNVARKESIDADIVMDTHKNRIVVRCSTAEPVVVNSIPNLASYINVFSALLEDEPVKTSKQVQVGRHMEECIEFTYKNVAMSEVKEFSKLMHRFENNANICILPVLMKYMKDSNDNYEDVTIAERLATIDKELTSGFIKCTCKEKYGIKTYIFGANMFLLVLRETGRIGVYADNLINRVSELGEETLKIITESCKNSGKSINRISMSTEISKEDFKFEVTKGNIPFNLSDGVKNDIKAFNYDKADKLVLPMKIDGGDTFNISVVIMSGFNYTQKIKSTIKNKSYVVRTNNINVAFVG